MDWVFVGTDESLLYHRKGESKIVRKEGEAESMIALNGLDQSKHWWAEARPSLSVTRQAFEQGDALIRLRDLDSPVCALVWGASSFSTNGIVETPHPYRLAMHALDTRAVYGTTIDATYVDEFDSVRYQPFNWQKFERGDIARREPAPEELAPPPFNHKEFRTHSMYLHRLNSGDGGECWVLNSIDYGGLVCFIAQDGGEWRRLALPDVGCNGGLPLFSCSQFRNCVCAATLNSEGLSVVLVDGDKGEWQALIYDVLKGSERSVLWASQVGNHILFVVQTLDEDAEAMFLEVFRVAVADARVIASGPLIMQQLTDSEDLMPSRHGVLM